MHCGADSFNAILVPLHSLITHSDDSVITPHDNASSLGQVDNTAGCSGQQAAHITAAILSLLTHICFASQAML